MLQALSSVARIFSNTAAPNLSLNAPTEVRRGETMTKKELFVFLEKEKNYVEEVTKELISTADDGMRAIFNAASVMASISNVEASAEEYANTQEKEGRSPLFIYLGGSKKPQTIALENLTLKCTDHKLYNRVRVCLGRSEVGEAIPLSGLFQSGDAIKGWVVMLSTKANPIRF